MLFVIDSLTIGGAEKSLVSLLNLVDSSLYEIDLLLFRSGGDLERFIPKHVNILPVPEYFQFVNNSKKLVNKRLSFYYYRIKTSISLRVNNLKKNTIHSEQVVYRCINKIMNPIQKIYDVAIAYSQGLPTYFVANKVQATKKLAWINTDYVNTLYDKEIDFESYDKMDHIIAVSKNTQESVSKLRKEYNNKVEIILDIIDPNIINKMSEEYDVKEFEKSLINILSVGRLVTAKSYETAIKVARLLKNSGYKFKWFGIGEGPEKEKLQELIDKYQLNDYFILLGKKINPYAYMKNCDIYVQTSIKEGFGLTVCEAKILKKPIVCTNFPTAKEIIKHDMDGLIVNHDVESIYKGIIRYIDELSFKEKINRNLHSTEPYTSVNQVNKFYEIIEK